MELEQRVQALEQEVQLLKSQIQATLLEIQEHLLTNAYPTLRAEDTSSANGQIAPSAFGRPAPRAEIDDTDYGSPAVKRVSFNEPAVAEPSDNGRDLPLVKKVSLKKVESDDPEEEAPRPVAVRKVSPDEQKKSKPASAARPSVKPVQPAPEPEQPVNEGLMGEMEEWARKRLDKFGPRRTRELIDRYTEEGRMDEATRDTLLTIVAEYQEDDEEDEDMPPSRPASRTEREPAPVTAKKQREEMLRIVPDTRVTLIARPSVDGTTNYEENEELDDTTARSLVMRLISGVRNAGSSPKRKNKHG